MTKRKIDTQSKNRQFHFWIPHNYGVSEKNWRQERLLKVIYGADFAVIFWSRIENVYFNSTLQIKEAEFQTKENTGLRKFQNKFLLNLSYIIIKMRSL